MKLTEATKHAVDSHNIPMINQIAEQLRFQARMNYENTRDWFIKHAQIDADQFEQLMYECDSLCR